MSKRKMVLRGASRNQLVVAAKFRSGSGVHGKSNKALRRAEKVQDYRESGRVDRGIWLLPRDRLVRSQRLPPAAQHKRFSTVFVGLFQVKHMACWRTVNAFRAWFDPKTWSQLSWGCSSVGRAVALHAAGHRFKSDHFHQIKNGV
jgi:hypothetical protein